MFNKYHSSRLEKVVKTIKTFLKNVSNNKRISDIFLALFSIILFSPILFIFIIILKFSGDREIFITERVGYRNNIFLYTNLQQ